MTGTSDLGFFQSIMSVARQHLGFDANRIFGLLAGSAIVALLVILTRRPPDTAPPQRGKARTSGPLVAFEPAFFDYGPVFQAETVSHAFKLVNRSTNALRVVVMETSCSCTLVSTNLLGQVLTLGGETLIPLEFHSGSRSGPVDSTVTVVLQAHAVRHVTQATLHTTVVPDFTLEPRAATFEEVLPGQITVRTARLKPVALPDVELIRTQMWKGPFGISVLPRTVSVTFQAPPSAHRRTYTQTLVLRTTSQRVPDQLFSMSAEVMPEIDLAPRAFVFAGLDLPAHVRLTACTRRPSKVVAVHGLTSEGSRDLHQTRKAEDAAAGWSQRHSLVLQASELAGVTNLQVVLKLDFGAGRVESRSAFATVQRLSHIQ